MERQPIISRIEFSVIAHATEDVEKVCLSVKNLISRDLRDNVAFEQECTMGHHGNPITSVKATITGQEATKRLITDLGSRLSSLDRSTLSDDLAQSVDTDGNLYLRFDKQAAYLGEVQLRQQDPIRVKIRFQGRSCTVEAIRRTCKEMGLIS